MFFSFQGVHWLKKITFRAKEDSAVLMWAGQQASVKFLLYISNITEVTAILVSGLLLFSVCTIYFSRKTCTLSFYRVQNIRHKI